MMMYLPDVTRTSCICPYLKPSVSRQPLFICLLFFSGFRLITGSSSISARNQSRPHQRRRQHGDQRQLQYDSRERRHKIPHRPRLDRKASRRKNKCAHNCRRDAPSQHGAYQADIQIGIQLSRMDDLHQKPRQSPVSRKLYHHGRKHGCRRHSRRHGRKKRPGKTA